jgi:hypothetical protein
MEKYKYEKNLDGRLQNGTIIGERFKGIYIYIISYECRLEI